MNTDRPGRPRRGVRLDLALALILVVAPALPRDARAQVAWLHDVRIEQGAPCEGCPAQVCPGDSIDVELAGNFPDGCRSLLGVSLRPNPAVTPLPLPPIIHIAYESHVRCAVCTQAPVAWSAHVRLPGQPHLGGITQFVRIEGEEIDLCAPDSASQAVGTLGVPFVVADSCSTLDACASVGWNHHARYGSCDGTFDLNTPAEPVLRIGSQAPIAGVEGGLLLHTPALRIESVAAARPDWTVQWTRNAEGVAHYVAFANTPSAAIPGHTDGERQPLLKVRVGASGAGELPEYATIDAFEILVSDPQGGAILSCPQPAIDPPSTWGLLCRSGTCDVNIDGRKDVRDLVLMVGCLAPLPDQGAACDDSTRFDCDRNGRFNLDDVFCCGRAMLGGDGNGPPPDSLRAAPDVALRFDLPRDAGERTIEVPLELGGLHHPAAGVAAARVDIAYPEHLYEVVGVKFEGLVTQWWTAYEVEGGRVRAAMLDLSPLPDRPLPPDLIGVGSSIRLSLKLRPGAVAGGMLAIANSDFAAIDGVALEPSRAVAQVALGSGQVALTPPSPNPFGGNTAFTLTVPAAGPVDVGVFDVAGRRVATLMRETNAASGVYALAWNGTDEARGRAVGGVYFVRVVTGAGGTSTKLLFLPGGSR